MTAQLNHTIVWCRDQAKSAAFLSSMLGLPRPERFARFLVVPTGNGVSMDYAEKDGPIAGQHYAFLVSDAEFDAVMQRIEERGLDYWADPAQTRKGEINHRYGGRGVYFPDPDGHLLEAITTPYSKEGQA
jgi:catechol 2,3-dioxygenase-like lactoylglutathione lyase family enzyme